MENWNPGDQCFFIESNMRVREGTIKSLNGEFAMVRFGYDSGIRLRTSKIYHTEDEAAKSIRGKKRKNQYDYM